MIDAFFMMYQKLISNYTIINFTNHLKEKNLSAKSINDILIVLGLAFKYAEEEYELEHREFAILKKKRKIYTFYLLMNNYN